MLETKIIKEKQDLTYLNWSKIRNSSGLAGSFLKSYSIISGRKLYYKLSNYDVINGVIGIECINEIIVDRLLTIFDIDHLHYQLINADIKVDEKIIQTYLCVSEDFKEKNKDKIALDNYYDIEHQPGEDKLSFCIKNHFDDYIYKMIVVDFIILNRDRHGANIEVLRNKKNKSLRIAPLFDHGLSLLFNCLNEESINDFNIMEDKPINSYIGSKSAKNNLLLIEKTKLPKLKKLTMKDKAFIFSDLEEILSKAMIDKIWNMIYSRWSYYEDFCNKR